MIVTLTLSPAVDKTTFVHGLAPGQVHRIRESPLDPAGKGINVSRLVDRLGDPTILYLVKPNLAEAERLVGRPLPDLASAVQAAREILTSGVEVVVISMGARGAVCAHGNRVWRALPPEIERRSAVGSGDSMAAGLALSVARGEEVVEGLRLGMAAGAGTAAAPGTALATPEDIARLLPQVRIDTLS